MLDTNRYEAAHTERKVFEDRVIKEFYKNTFVRTIDVIGKEEGDTQSSFADAKYIMHVVGHLMDVTGIVVRIAKIYEELDDYNCMTRVVPIAEKITNDDFNSLFETVGMNADVARIILDIIRKNKNRKDPFVIKRLNSTYMNEVAELYYSCSGWDAIINQRLNGVYVEQWMPSFYEFVYGVSLFVDEKYFSVGGVQKIENNEIEELYVRCNSLIRGTALWAERCLKSFLAEKAAKYGSRKEFEGHIENLNNNSKKKMKLGSVDLNDSSLGSLIDLIICYNNNSEDKIVGAGFGKEINTIRDISYYRNCFSHAANMEYSDEVSNIGKILDCIKDRNTVLEIMRAINKTVNILIKNVDGGLNDI